MKTAKSIILEMSLKKTIDLMKMQIANNAAATGKRPKFKRIKLMAASMSKTPSIFSIRLGKSRS